jgi:hypothetical protein
VKTEFLKEFLEFICGNGGNLSKTKKLLFYT